MRERVIEIICEIKNDMSLSKTLTGESGILTEAKLDSLQLINFILRIEDEFSIEIDFARFDFRQLSSIDAFCSFISQIAGE